MKVVIYSGGGRKTNHSLNKKLISMTQGNPTFVYIPVTCDEDPKYFAQFKKYWNFYGIQKFINFPLDKKHSSKKINKALSSEVLYFCGGNTFEFLKNLRNSGLKNKIIKASKNGSILTGQSAGIIILTPTIDTASIPSLDRDENDVSIKSKKSLGILPFDFSPHYYYNKISDNELKKHSLDSGRTVFACNDGDGIVIENNKQEFIGKIFKFKKGKKEKIK